MTTDIMPIKFIKPLMSNKQWDNFCWKHPKLRCVPKYKYYFNTYITNIK